MAPAMSEAASPIGIANVSLIPLFQRHVLSRLANHVRLTKASESEVHTSTRPICIIKLSINLCPGTRLLLNVELHSPSWYSHTCPIPPSYRLTCPRLQANQALERRPLSTPCSRQQSRTMQTIDAGMRSKWIRLLKSRSPRLN